MPVTSNRIANIARATGRVHAGMKTVTDYSTSLGIRNISVHGLCGMSSSNRVDPFVTTDRSVTCRTCLKMIDANPCPASVQPFKFPYACDEGGPHDIHHAIAGSVQWREGEKAAVCVGGLYAVLWRNREESIAFTHHQVPSAVAGHSGPVATDVYTWFYDEREVESGTDRERLASAIPAALKDLRAEEDERQRSYGVPTEECRDHTSELHVCQ